MPERIGHSIRALSHLHGIARASSRARAAYCVSRSASPGGSHSAGWRERACGRRPCATNRANFPFRSVESGATGGEELPHRGERFHSGGRSSDRIFNFINGEGFMNTRKTGSIALAAAAAIMFSTASFTAAAADDGKVKCEGANTMANGIRACIIASFQPRRPYRHRLAAVKPRSVFHLFVQPC